MRNVLIWGRILEPRERVELSTCRLRIGCSTTELPRPFILQDLFPCQSYFRTASIKLPSNYHQTAALTGPEIGTVIGRLTICFPQRAGNDPETFPLAILAIRWKNALSFSLTIQGSGGATETRNHTQISLSLYHSFRKFLVLQILPFSKRRTARRLCKFQDARVSCR